MKKIFTHILNFLDNDYRQKQQEEAFLAEATDLVDLERRIKILENAHTQRTLNVFTI